VRADAVNWWYAGWLVGGVCVRGTSTVTVSNACINGLVGGRVVYFGWLEGCSQEAGLGTT
jgi:hypothetical protein